MIENTLFPTEAEIPAQYKVKPVEQRTYLINGEIRTWAGQQQEVLSPIYTRNEQGLTRVRLGSVPMLDEKESLSALEAATAAYKNGWGRMSAKQRIGYVEGFLDRMVKVREPVIRGLMWEIGKSAKDATTEFDRTVDYVRETITALKDMVHADSKFIRVDGHLAQNRRSPFGKALCVGPFNYPLNETFTTLIPALLMGNTVIFKPAKYGILFHNEMMEAYRDSFPAGVINTVYGDGGTVLGPLMRSGEIDLLAFIGSTKVGNILTKQHPKPNLQTILGLGAKNPCFVLQDADLDLAAQEAVAGSLSYNGQRCTALKTLYVHRAVAEKFTEKFVEKVERLNWGMPWTPNVNITPLPEEGKVGFMQEYVTDALAKGAVMANSRGSNSLESFFAPTVLFNVNPQMNIFHNEQFGPVVPIVVFEDLNEPMKYVSASQICGQQASIFSYDEHVVGPLIDKLAFEVCRINLNGQCKRGPDSLPFTGRKTSAVNVLSITDALKVCAIRTGVVTPINDKNLALVRRITQGRHSKFMESDHLV